MKYNSRTLQYTLTKATKEKPHKFVQTNIRQNNSGLEAWRALRATYDQGQQPSQLNSVMNPTWSTGMNNRNFIKSFNTWIDEEQSLPIGNGTYKGSEGVTTTEQVEGTIEEPSTIEHEHKGSGR
eukprot:5447148-Amphidinium_carterae.1